MPDIEKLVEMLRSPQARSRYRACDELSVAASLPPAAIAALQNAANDADDLVREAAKRALRLHEPPAAVPSAVPMTEPTSGPQVARNKWTRRKWTAEIIGVSVGVGLCFVLPAILDWDDRSLGTIGCSVLFILGGVVVALIRHGSPE